MAYTQAIPNIIGAGRDR